MAKKLKALKDQPLALRANPSQARLSFADPAWDGYPTAERLTQWEPSEWPVAEDWTPVIQGFLVSAVGVQLGRFITQRLAHGAIIYPPQPFRALELTPLSSVQVVILGQDPYHGPHQAHGLAFSVPAGTRPPPSLKNIFKEISRSQAGQSVQGTPSHSAAVQSGSLESWAQQGVLLLNTCLTVEQGAPASHAQQGWEVLTDALIQAVSDSREAVVFMLWGAHAQTKRSLIAGHHLVLTANHPSPLSANRPPKPFVGCDHFVLANAWLQKQGHKLIHW